ncbi:MAG: glycoside hydrolase family 38 C-terminal domain-containing protein [Candidatus Lokiarchaeia archaeon]
MKANNIIIVPETHWDREWYLHFQGFRARLVIMMDKLLDILKTDLDYKNFTFDGQTIPIEDYLEVRPDKEEEIKKYVRQGRLSIGPMYVLPDEFLVSGESIIRNLMIGHQISRRFGRIMKAGYIPDPFGHIAQLPQIIQGFEIPSILFWRGFGNEFEENNLNMEFIWNAPGKAASLLAIFLRYGYMSLELYNTKKIKGQYKPALRTIKAKIENFEKYTATPNVLLNNGSDHHEARPEIPEIIKQWNNLHPDQPIEQADFEYYINKVLEFKPKLNEFQGELRGGRFAHLLSGVFSARMWIKQRNTKIEYLYEKYTEPISTITWVLDKNNKFIYPKNYILTGLKWLQKNAPHDSICGCSIDEVHDEMKTRYDWAEQIANEIYKNSFLYLSEFINIDSNYKDLNVLIVYNPLPWHRKDIIRFNNIAQKKSGEKFPFNIKVIDAEGKEIEYQHHFVKEEPKHTRELSISHSFTFLAEVPACGYKTYYIIPVESVSEFAIDKDNFKITRNFLENEFYRININSDGFIEVVDKKTGVMYEKFCEFDDMGDWGDEYDFSGPKENQTDLAFTTEDAAIFEKTVFIDGPTQKTFKLRLNLKLPHSLTEDRYNREEWLVDNKITIYISLYKGIKRIDFNIELENNSKDHRIRVLFPTKIKAEKVYADGHFYVVPRKVKLPKADNWAQKPLPTNHQKDFVSVSNTSRTFAVLNKGLPEYEAKINEDNTITFAITLLRCIEWLSRDDFITRMSHAGPGIKTPGAQCLGKHKFELSITTTTKPTWLDSEIHLRGKEFNNPLRLIFPTMAQTPQRVADKVVLKPTGILSYFIKPKKKTIEPYLPAALSFLEIDNKNVVLSALKKSEEGDYLIIRVYNVSSNRQNARLSFYDKFLIKKAEIVNFLEEQPNNEIKAKINNYFNSILEITVEPHIIVTFKIKIEFSE